MKFALCNEMFECWNTADGFDFDRVFRFIVSCGYEGVEIAPFTMNADARKIDAATRRKVRDLAVKSGLEITGIHWLLARTEGFGLTSPEASVREATNAYFRELIRLCRDLGGRYMVLGSPQQRNLAEGMSREQGHEYAAEVLRPLVPLLEECDVQIALEPLSTAETNMLTSAAETVELIDRIGAPERIALHLDCKAMSSEDRPIPEVIRANRKHLVYFHANDANLLGPGFGQTQFEPILAALEDVGYAGWVSVEVFDYTPGVERLARESLDHLRKCLP